MTGFSRTNALRLGVLTWRRNGLALTAMSLVVHAPLLVWMGLLLGDARNVASWHRFGRVLYDSVWLTVGLLVWGISLGARRFLPAFAGTLARTAELTRGRRWAVFGTFLQIWLSGAVGCAIVAGVAVGVGDLPTHLIPWPALFFCVIYAPVVASTIAATYALLATAGPSSAS